MKNEIDTIIFDLDGTLLDTLKDLTNSVNYALAQYKLPVHSIDRVRQMVGNGIYVLFEQAIPQGRSFEKYAECVKTFQKHYELHKKDFTKPFPGIMELLKECYEKGYKMAVVSNKFDLAVKQLCEEFFSPYITSAIGESSRTAPKPAPDTVFEAMKDLNSTADTCIYVGDSDVDIATAKNAGIPCISVTWGFRDREFLMKHGASCLADDTKDITDILRNYCIPINKPVY